MNYKLIRNLKSRKYFSIEELADLLRIKPESARVLCSRYVKSGFFMRLKRDLYCLSEAWDNFSNDDLLKTANLLQVPSYISFMTALSFYEATTQVQRGFFESASIKRSVKYNIADTDFNYYKLKKNYYFGFIRKEGLFIALKEKAFIDSVYLYSFGKYKIDFNSIDLNKLDKKKIKEYIRIFPAKTRRIVRQLCKI